MRKIITILILGVVSLFADCYTQDRMKTFNLIEKAFSHSGVKIKNLYWNSPQSTMYQNKGYSMLFTFDGKAKRASVWYDNSCNPTGLKVSSGYGKVSMYYFNVKGNDIQLTRTRENTYKK